MIDIDAVRAGIPALANSVYLNTGTFGPLPTVAADEIRRAYSEVERLGTFSPPIFAEMELQGFEAVRGQVAALLGASPAEVALTRNVTDGINIVLHGIDWQAGDEVILTDQEHPAGTVPWLALAQRAGVVLRWLELSLDSDAVMRRFEALLTPKTRLAQLSHVSCLTGFRLPVGRLCATARQAGVLTLIDGAHAEGQFSVDFQTLGCDFYAACGHKWLLGPQGVGMVAIRRELVEMLRPLWLGWDVQQSYDRGERRYQLQTTAARFEQSTRPWPLYLAFGKSIDFVTRVGLDKIETRVQALRSRFVAALSDLPGVTVLSPVAGATGTGLITARVEGWSCEALQERLWKRHRVITNIIREFNALRFSIAFFTTEAELELALDAINSAVRDESPKIDT